MNSNDCSRQSTRDANVCPNESRQEQRQQKERRREGKTARRLRQSGSRFKASSVIRSSQGITFRRLHHENYMPRTCLSLFHRRRSEGRREQGGRGKRGKKVLHEFFSLFLVDKTRNPVTRLDASTCLPRDSSCRQGKTLILSFPFTLFFQPLLLLHSLLRKLIAAFL